MDTEIKQSKRIQTSFVNSAERKALIWLAERQPHWVTSDLLTFVGSLGAFLVGLGFILTRYDICWLWLSIAGLVVNWYGDSLDGTLARVRNCQRPIYGYYVDHSVDCINEAFMFIGAGLSPLVHIELAMSVFILYLFMTINVSMNAHLKSEFRLTYAKLGPTEFRILIALCCLILIIFPSLGIHPFMITLFGHTMALTSLDFLTALLIVALTVIYISTFISDARSYAKIDPPKEGK